MRWALGDDLANLKVRIQTVLLQVGHLISDLRPDLRLQRLQVVDSSARGYQLVDVHHTQTTALLQREVTAVRDRRIAGFHAVGGDQDGSGAGRRQKVGLALYRRRAGARR